MNGPEKNTLVHAVANCPPPAVGALAHAPAWDAPLPMNRKRQLFPPERQYAIWHRIRGPFLLPTKFTGHRCEWEPFSYTQAGCILCGAEHRCAEDNTECIAETCDDSHTSCLITGAVIREHAYRDEWDASSRAHVEPPKKKQSMCAPGIPPVIKRNSACDVWSFVEAVVRLLLDSDTAEQCRQQENRRLCQALLTALHREMLRQLDAAGFVNMVTAAAAAAWHTRKLRRPVTLPREELEHVVKVSTDAVCNVMLKYNSQQTSKILNSDARRKEFACSMFYLMRNGVDCRGQCILPRMKIMGSILPLETFLPESFRIRSKSITEGENLLKIELCRIHKM